MRAVTSNAKFSDLTRELHEHLTTTENKQGALSKYANTYATTSMSQYVGENNRLLTNDLGLEWFEYVGSNIETTREFCEHLTEKRYIHKSEIKTILKGEIDGYQCEIYEKTGLPKGMIEGTNEQNFQVNCGGWNCRHQLVPVAKEAVPLEIRAKFEKKAQDKIDNNIEDDTKGVSIGNNNTQFNNLITNLDNDAIEYREVKPLQNKLTDDEIINRICGPDQTVGSCSSLAFAYAGNKGGYDVLDFRGGESREFFSKGSNILEIAKSVGGKIESGFDGYKIAAELLKGAEIGKEYYFTSGNHASIIKRTKSGFEYLELQSENKNGFKPLTVKVLKTRFKTQKSITSYGLKIKMSECLIDLELLRNNKGFIKMLGYINTSSDKQQKGIGGGIK